MTPLAAAQQKAPGPERSWIHDPDGSASINDVSIDAEGKTLAVVQGDADDTDDADPELLVWDLTRPGNPAHPSFEDDPSSSSTVPSSAPEGLGEVAVEPRPGGQGDLIAIGREGSASAPTANNVYVFSRKQGTHTQLQYDGDRSAPSGAVQDLSFVTDRSQLLVYHANTLSLAERDQGTEYTETADGRWSPPGQGASLQSVAVSHGSSRIAVATSQGDVNPEVTLRVFAAENGKLSEIVEPRTTSQPGSQATVAISDDGEYVALGAGGQNLDYFRIKPTNDTNSDFDFRFSSPWHRSPGEVTALTLSPDGNYLVAGTSDGELHVFQRSELNPLVADNAISEPVSLPAGVQSATFADGNESLFVYAAGVFGFSQRQFDPASSIEPLWQVSSLPPFAVSDNAERIGTSQPGSDGGQVAAYERSFNASLTVDAPDTIRPGSKATLDLTVTNVGSEFDEYTFEVSGLNSSWTVDAPDESIQLLPRETANTTIDVTPSAGQPPGSVDFDVQVRSQLASGDPVVGTSTTSVRIPTVHAANLEIDDSSRQVSTETTVTLNPTISNEGNVEERIELTVDQQADWPVRIGEQTTDSRSFELGPQQSQEVPVQVRVPADVAEGSRNQITLEAQPAGGGQGASATIPLVVNPEYGATLTLPSEPVDAQPGDRVPVEFTIENSGNTRDTFQLRAQANASDPNLAWRAGLSTDSVKLDSEESTTAEVTVRVPRGASPGSSAEIAITVTSQATGDELTSSSFSMQIPTEEEDDGPVGVPVPWIAPLLALGAGAVWRRNNR